MEIFVNLTSATLASGIDSSVTSLPLTTGHGARFGAITAGDKIRIAFLDATKNVTEIAYMTAISGDTATIVRGQDGTSGAVHLAGDTIEARIGKSTMETFTQKAKAGTDAIAEAVAATSKATPVDADILPIADSAASNVLKKLTWANIKATLKTYFDTIYVAATGAFANVVSPGGNLTGAINEARGTVAMHATTMDIWTSKPAILDGTGSAVTITAIANAPQAGARRTLYPIAGTVITNGASFAVDGGANYTTVSGDALEFEAITTSTYRVHITKADGTAVVVPAATSGQLLGAFRNLQLSATGLSANVTVTADEIVVEDSSNVYKTLRTVSLTIAGTTTGTNALDTGTIATSTWYSVWVIWNGTTTAGLLSTSATAPTMPSGYTYKARIGWIRTDGTANKYPLSFIQYGSTARYKVAAGSNLTALPTLASGTQGSVTIPTWVAVAVGNFVPATATMLACVTSTGTHTTQASVNMAAPSNAYGAYSSATNPPPVVSTAPSSEYAVGGCDILLESTNIYVAQQRAAALTQCAGWEDNI